MLQCLLLYFQSLQEAFSRCVAVLSHSSKPDDMAVQVTLTNSTLLSTERHMEFSCCLKNVWGGQLHTIMVSVHWVTVDPSVEDLNVFVKQPN